MSIALQRWLAEFCVFHEKQELQKVWNFPMYTWHGLLPSCSAFSLDLKSWNCISRSTHFLIIIFSNENMWIWNTFFFNTKYFGLWKLEPQKTELSNNIILKDMESLKYKCLTLNYYKKFHKRQNYQNSQYALVHL